MSLYTSVSATTRPFPWRRFLLHWGILHAAMQAIVAAATWLAWEPDSTWYVYPVLAWVTAIVVAFSCESVMIISERRALVTGLRLGSAVVKSLDVLGTYAEDIHASYGDDGTIVVRAQTPTGALEVSDADGSLQWSRKESEVR